LVSCCSDPDVLAPDTNIHIGAFSLWGGGWSAQRGVLDFAGGYVIHVSSGTAGFVAAYWVGPRAARDRGDKPHNTLLALIGCGILWVGWNGFNGGAPLAAGPVSGVAVWNTNIATATSLLVWMSLDVIFFGKPAVVGAVQGMITGLVGITPAAGFVAGWGALIIGVVAGSVPWLSMNVMGKKVKIFRKIDDTLGVFHTHLVAGFCGGLLTGIFATAEGCLAFAAISTGGAITGNGMQIAEQLAAFVFIVGWNVVVTSLICLFIKYVCRVPLRMSEEELLAGDDAVHGEAAYYFEDYDYENDNDSGHVVLGKPVSIDDIEASTPEKIRHEIAKKD
jgi:Amt family ammonium transporter